MATRLLRFRRKLSLRHLVIGLAAIFVSLAMLPALSLAENEHRVEQLRRYFEHLRKHEKFMGTVAVSIDGDLLFDQQFGVIDDGDTAQKAANSETQYRIGSITKTFTATMILQLIEEENLTLDTKLAKFFPDLKNADEITIEQMLRHRSGLGSVTADKTYRSWNTQAQSRAQMLEKIAAQPVRFMPGERTKYSNTNYLLLGYIIEEITGNTYAAELQSRIADRIGLKRTAYATNADSGKNVAMSFRRADDQWRPRSETDPSVPHGAGAIMSTASDLVVFAESLFAGKLIRASSVEQMTKMVDGMGLGLIPFRFGEKIGYGHNGGIDGFQSTMAYFPDEKVAVAFVANGIDFSLNRIGIAVLSASFDQKLDLPSFDEVQVAQEKLRRYEGVYSSKTLPLKITVRINDKKLTAQATGQGAFPLTPSSDVMFRFAPAGVVITFAESAPGKGFDVLRLRQAGQDLKFTKE